MSVTYIPVALRRLVEERAHQCCEYCQLPAGVAFFPHEVDHIVAEKHGGATKEGNLAYTCGVAIVIKEATSARLTLRQELSVSCSTPEISNG